MGHVSWWLLGGINCSRRGWLGRAHVLATLNEDPEIPLTAFNGSSYGQVCLPCA